MLRKLGFARSLNYALCPKYWTWVKEKRKFSFFLTFDHLTTPIEGPDFFLILNLGFLRFLSREYPPHYLFTSTSFSNSFKGWKKKHTFETENHSLYSLISSTWFECCLTQTGVIRSERAWFCVKRMIEQLCCCLRTSGSQHSQQSRRGSKVKDEMRRHQGDNKPSFFQNL